MNNKEYRCIDITDWEYIYDFDVTEFSVFDGVTQIKRGDLDVTHNVELETKTGNRDKNNKFIYDGDLINYENGTWLVCWDFSELEWYLKADAFKIYFDKVKFDDAEIVGNVSGLEFKQ